MVQLGEDAGFNEKRFHILGVSDSFRVWHLDGDWAVEVIVVSKIDPSEPALTQASEDRVTPDLGGISIGTTEPSAGRIPCQALVSSGNTRPSTGGCEPSVWDRLFVSSIAQSLTTTGLIHDCQAEPLSHSKPGKRSNARSLSFQGCGTALSPHPRNQPVPDPLGVFLVASQFVLEGLVFPQRSQDQQRNHRMAGISAHKEPSAKGMPTEKQEAKERTPDAG